MDRDRIWLLRWGGKWLRASWPGRAIGAAIAAGLLLAGLTCWQNLRGAATLPQNRPIEELAAGYVSSATCRSCHPGNYASWHASYHRTMTQLATPDTLVGPLPATELTLDGAAYRVERRGEKTFVRTRPAGEEEFGAPQPVVMLTGSHTLQMLWLATGEGRTLIQFPFAYIIAERRWAPVAQTFLYPPEFRTIYAAGEWNGACMDCHTTQGRSRFVAGNAFDSRVSELGIACEACHSEGREHVTRNRNPLRRYLLHLTGDRDPTIANADRMDGPKASLVCGQCHSVLAFNNMEDKLAWNREGVRYRPGDPALDLHWVAQPKGDDHPAQRAFIREQNPAFFRDRFWADGMVRVTGREFNGVAASPCYRGGHFSCLSCHAMHPPDGGPAALKAWANQQLKPGMDGDAACTQCHQPIAANLAAHTHHGADSSGSRCYNCHLPHTSYGLLRGIRSHQVSSPTARESVEVGRPNACNLCHLDRTLAWTAGKLHAWYGQPEPELGRDDREISAAVQWILRGDAGQRGLVAWGMGWKPAQEASGRDWLYPYLILTLNDSYAAVRFDAWKSLQTLPGFADLSYDYTAEEPVTRAAVVDAYARWQRQVRSPRDTYPPATLLDARGGVPPEVLRRLLSERDNRQIFLAE